MQYSRKQINTDLAPDLKAPLPVNEKLLAMGQMATSLAHELRNPLGSIELYCSLLKREFKGNGKAEEILQSMMQGIRTMGHIITNCLQFTKEIRPNKRSFKSASLFLAETCEYARPKNLDNKVSVSWEEIGNEEFLMDPYLMGQLLINLIVNAADAVVSKENPQVKVILNHTLKDQWFLEVIDNGIGLSSDVKERMFDPFFTTKEKGTGLGLPIVYVIGEAHDGNLEFNNAIGGGVHVRAVFNNKE
jgi:signal transduction histidine kinase